MTETLTRTKHVLIAGQWQPSDSDSSFQATDPSTGAKLEAEFPVSKWADCDRALAAAAEAYEILRTTPGDEIAEFLEKFADEIEKRADSIVAAAHQETGLPVAPRLQDVELPRTTNQLRQAAQAARSQIWRQPVIDTSTGIRSCLGPLGPVCVFGPNNFPFAFGSVSGGDFAAAIAAGNPVIGKSNSSHPETTRLMAEAALDALEQTSLPKATVQLIYRTSHADGERLVADPRLAATGYTGSRSAGLKLKAAAEQAGNQIFLELSSCNPVFILPGALQERGAEIAAEFSGSCLMGAGQFCTNPGLIFLLGSENTEAFIAATTAAFDAAASGTLLSGGVQTSLCEGIDTLIQHGAKRLTSQAGDMGGRIAVANTLLRISGSQFLAEPELFQTEIFGNASLLVVSDSPEELLGIARHLEGNLTGCIYSDSEGSDDDFYSCIEPELRQRVGRLLNDKMPTGVAVSAAMNHGGPFPATGSPQFTAVGIPAAITRFTSLHCYDNVRHHRLPSCLHDTNPHQDLFRFVDGRWTNADVSTKV